MRHRRYPHLKLLPPPGFVLVITMLHHHLRSIENEVMLCSHDLKKLNESFVDNPFGKHPPS